jgi:D-xylose transport system permease protein
MGTEIHKHKIDSSDSGETSLIRKVLTKEGFPLFFAMVLTFLIFRIATESFLDPRNIANLLGQIAPLVLIAVASTLVIVMGEIDLSLGSIAGFSGALAAFFIGSTNLPWVFGIILTILITLAIALLQGAIVVFGRVRSFAVTLAGFLVWHGVQVGVLGNASQRPLNRSPLADLSITRVSSAWVLLGSLIYFALYLCFFILAKFKNTRASEGNQSSRRILTVTRTLLPLVALCLFSKYLDRVGGIPLTLFLVLVITLCSWFLLTRMPIGRHMYSIGGNPAAARANGISVTKVRLVGFILAGVLASLAGISIISYTGGADSSTGAGSLLLQGIGATVIGGVSLIGGRGSVWGAFGGAVLLSAVQNGLALLSLPFYVIDIVEGLVVLTALLADALIRRKYTFS